MNFFKNIWHSKWLLYHEVTLGDVKISLYKKIENKKIKYKRKIIKITKNEKS